MNDNIDNDYHGGQMSLRQAVHLAEIYLPKTGYNTDLRLTFIKHIRSISNIFYMLGKIDGNKEVMEQLEFMREQLKMDFKETTER